MNFRFYYMILGGHTHVRVFCAAHRSWVHSKCGDLVFRNDAWEAFRNHLPSSGSVEYIAEEPTT
jgi:hypothetical protein